MVYIKLDNEVRSTVRNVTRPFISDIEAQALPCLKCSIMETMRMLVPLEVLLRTTHKVEASRLARITLPTAQRLAWLRSNDASEEHS